MYIAATTDMQINVTPPSTPPTIAPMLFGPPPESALSSFSASSDGLEESAAASSGGSDGSASVSPDELGVSDESVASAKGSVVGVGKMVRPSGAVAQPTYV